MTRPTTNTATKRAARRWATEGEKFDVNLGIFTNARIDTFLDSEDRTFLIAAKGMGKTLLLRKKRQRLERKTPGALILPFDSEADYIKLPHTFSKIFEEQIRNLSFWKNIWEIGFQTSVLLNAECTPGILAFFETWIDHYPRRLSREITALMELRQPRRTQKPSSIVDAFLSDQPSRFFDFQRNCAHALSQTCTSELRHAVYVFIDSFDQELRAMSREVRGYLDREVWCSGQMGLIKAAWDINRRNPHFKVFTSARQEAWSAFYDEDRQVLRTHVEFLSYAPEDLRGLANVLFRTYESDHDLPRYLGFSQLETKGKTEDVFQYLLRHSLGRPRGIAVLGDSLHGQIGGRLSVVEREARFREIVNTSAPEDLVNNYLKGEMKVFLQSLSDDDRIDFLWRNIPSNVLTMADLERIRDRFAEQFDLDRDHCHPFCELLNLGLLGHVGTTTAGERMQIFRGASEFSWDTGRILPGQATYILHPALTDIIRRQNAQFITDRRILTGRGLPWSAADDAAAEAHSFRIFVSYASEDGAFVKRCLKALSAWFDTHGVPHAFWLDKVSLSAGEGFQAALEEGLERSHRVLLFYTARAEKSAWVEKEWRYVERQEAASCAARLIPVTNDKAVKTRIKGFLGEKHVPLIETDRTGGSGAFERSIAKLAADIKRYFTAYHLRGDDDAPAC